MDKRTYNIQLRVRYADTDQMGVVYYTRYLEWTEVARTEFFRARGLPYTELERKGFAIPLASCSCQFKSPTKYDDLINIETILREVKNTSFTFDYKMSCENKLVATASTTHVCVLIKDFKPTKIPAELEKILS